MTLTQALADLGVDETSLSAEQIDYLDTNGYLPLPGILNADQIKAFVDRLETLELQEGEDAGKEVHQEKGTLRLSNLVDKDPIFEICFTHPVLLAGIGHVLSNDFKLSSLNSRAALPGCGLQGLHADFGEALDASGGRNGLPDFHVCNSIWLLTDFTEENGATRVVPGSHLSGKLPNDVMADPSEPHPDEIILNAKAGTVVIFNSHTWHGGTLNRSDGLRRGMHAYFCRRNRPQQTNQKEFLTQKTRDRLSPSAQVILDI